MGLGWLGLGSDLAVWTRKTSPLLWAPSSCKMGQQKQPRWGCCEASTGSCKNHPLPSTWQKTAAWQVELSLPRDRVQGCWTDRQLGAQQRSPMSPQMHRLSSYSLSTPQIRTKYQSCVSEQERQRALGLMKHTINPSGKKTPLNNQAAQLIT